MNTFQQIGDVAAKVVDPWAWWQNALKGEFGPIHHEPEQGYFRVRRKGEPWEPVAVWKDETGAWLAYRAGKEVHAEDIWTWACRNPISFEAYEKAMAGGGFDDEPAPAVTIGHNSGEADPLDALKIELAGEAEQVADFLKREVKTQAEADRIGIWSKRLTDLSKRADSLRVTEKEPHLAASRAVDDRWRDVIADAKEWAAKAKKHVEAFLIAQKRAEEARAKAAAEEAAKLRREAEQAALAAQKAEAARIAEGVSDAAAIAEHNERAEADRMELLRKAQEADKAAEVRNASAGRTGARVSIRVEKVGQIVDYDALLMALKDRSEVRDLIQSLANRAAKSGFELAGMKIVEIEKVV